MDRRKSPIEIAEEYRRLREAEERKRLELATNPKVGYFRTFYCKVYCSAFRHLLMSPLTPLKFLTKTMMTTC